jgi:putative transposase
MIVQNKTAVYHVMSRTALDGFPLEAFEKDFLLDLIKRMSGLFFTEVYGFSLDGQPLSPFGQDDSGGPLFG